MAADRQILTQGEDQIGLRSNVVSALDCAAGSATPGMLDPLIRALDQAVARSARAAHRCGETALRD
jgi:hypothetical protein